ncbi:hypothetical protein [Helicobacter pullorum]|uniref:hypothetical protein n=1 Tax=Helicobacter pullorum TaxID=35818 RepID=UPI001D977EBB|nr:hypothetical protein [Helicobacter pullorum]HJF83455.1 hypothetical protein [Helicobacter pullorum]
MGLLDVIESVRSAIGEATASATDSQSKTAESNVKARKNNSDNIKNAIDKKYTLQPSEEFFKFDTNAIHNSDKGALIKEFDAVQLKTK